MSKSNDQQSEPRKPRYNTRGGDQNMELDLAVHTTCYRGRLQKSARLFGDDTENRVRWHLAPFIKTDMTAESWADLEAAVRRTVEGHLVDWEQVHFETWSLKRDREDQEWLEEIEQQDKPEPKPKPEVCARCEKPIEPICEGCKAQDGSGHHDHDEYDQHSSNGSGLVYPVHGGAWPPNLFERGFYNSVNRSGIYALKV